jgi:cytochrome c peroxidase
MCHIPAQGFTVNETRLAVGINGKTTKRNPPTLYNVAYQRLLFHDGREFTLEDQIISPLTNPVEMGNPSIGYVTDKVRRLPGYDEQFHRAFGERVNVANLGKAIASYERTLLSANSPFDRWHFGGDATALSNEAKTGFEIFSGKGKCIGCHPIGKEASLFTDHEFHNTGIAQLHLIPEKTVDVDLGGGLIVQMPRAQVNEILTPPEKDLGRYEITLDPNDLWRYKTPSLRNVALTAPYMHNGVLLTLEEVIDYYDHGGTRVEGQDARIMPLHLLPVEKRALLAFLHSLTGDNVNILAREPYPSAATQ